MKKLNIGFFLLLRTAAYGIGFLLTGLIFYFLGAINWLHDASSWWPIYGIFANLICLIALKKSLKIENRKIIDLINFNSQKIKNDLLILLILVPISMILGVITPNIFAYMAYGRYPTELVPLFNGIPLIVIILSIFLFPILNSFTEEIIYNGYCFTKIEEKSNKILAIILVLIFFTIQHIFIPFIPDLKYLSWRLPSFIPLILFWILIYIKMRRLTSLIIVHWIMDILSIISIILLNYK
jgi:membrane protease YdiL (CAAX protease family)